MHDVRLQALDMLHNVSYRPRRVELPNAMDMKRRTENLVEGCVWNDIRDDVHSFDSIALGKCSAEVIAVFREVATIGWEGGNEGNSKAGRHNLVA